jgi:hypothetical protein
MNQSKLNQNQPVFSQLYEFGEISGRITLWMDDAGSERVQVEFLPQDFTTPILYASIEPDELEDALFAFEMDRTRFLKEHYPEYYKGLFQ